MEPIKFVISHDGMFVWPATGRTGFGDGAEQVEIRKEQHKTVWIPMKALACKHSDGQPEVPGVWQLVGIPEPDFAVGKVKYPKGSLILHKRSKHVYMVEQDPSSGLTLEANMQPAYKYRLAGTFAGRARIWIRGQSVTEDGRFTKYKPKASK